MTAEISVPPVEVRRSARRTKTISAQRRGDVIVVDIPARMSRADEARLVPDLVEKFLAKEARSTAPRNDADLLARAVALRDRYLAHADVPDPRSIRWVTNQNTRWGSCSVATGDIRLSHRLAVMPSWVVDFVLLHELVHLICPDHGPDFQAHMAAYPRAERAQGFLDGYAAASRHADARD